jgi:hypothetical protein
MTELVPSPPLGRSGVAIAAHAPPRARTIRLPSSDLIEPCLRGVLGALHVGDGPTRLQLDLLGAVARAVGAPIDDLSLLEPFEPDELAAAIGDQALRHELVDLMVALEFVVHPLPPALAARVSTYAAALGVADPSLGAARALAHRHVGLLHADLLRSSWYTEQTLKGFGHGLGRELAHSKATYLGAPEDRSLAAKWQALGDHAEGTWGRGVHDFYRAHGFPLPGERHGIYEIGALHDWVHVLADYGTDPEGEIDVFTFIAGTMSDPHGFVLFLITLCLFQNASIGHVGGKRVVIARADTLADPGAVDRWAEALWRSSCCTVDPMGGVDHFALAGVPIDELRDAWSIPAKHLLSGGARPV